jgi:hypothetical protein
MRRQKQSNVLGPVQIKFQRRVTRLQEFLVASRPPEMDIERTGMYGKDFVNQT